jgi:hypothetical protein
VHADAHDNKGLADILAALEAAKGKKGVATKTVTAHAAVTKGNGTCNGQKTMTVTVQPASAAHGTGVASTIMVTPLPQMTTSMATVTINGTAAANSGKRSPRDLISSQKLTIL